MKATLNSIWKRHRRFAQRLALGAGVFLVLVQIAASYADVDQENEMNALRAGNLEKRMADLDLIYYPKIGERESLERQLGELLGKVGLGARSGVKIPDGDFNVDFASRKTAVYSEFRDRANSINLSSPEQKDVTFDEGSDLTDQEWIDRYRQLEVLRRVLNVALAIGVPKILAIRPGSAEAEGIPGNSEKMLIRYPVQLDMVLAYEGLLGFLEAFQKDGDFVSVEIAQVTKAPEEGERMLKATILFVGLDLGEPRDLSRRSGTRRTINNRKGR